jgi:hypothetical protein
MVIVHVPWRWWSLVPSYFGLIFKFKLELEHVVNGLDMTTSSQSELNLKIKPKESVSTNLRDKASPS